MDRNIYKALVLVSTVAVCLVGTAGVTKGREEPLLTQDLNTLKDSDGKIVEQGLVEIETEFEGVDSSFKERVQCHRIRYLSDGLKVVGFVLRPKVEGMYPVIIYNRGGYKKQGIIKDRMLYYLAYLSSHGYVVMASQYRGNDGGEGEQDFGDKDVNDVLNLIPLAKSLPFADENRIGMLGFSSGGMMTYVATKKGAEIKAACVVGGPTDFIQSYKERPKDRGQMKKTFGGSPKRKEVEYKKRSVCYWPEKITVPVLILHGEDDERVKLGQVQELAKKLDELGKTYELIIFPETGHTLRGHDSEKNQRILEWFQKYLQSRQSSFKKPCQQS